MKVVLITGIGAVWANAGIASFGPMTLTDPAAWERTLEVNLRGAFKAIRAPGMSAYAASKAGVEATWIDTPRFVRLAHVMRAALTTRVFRRDLIAAAPEIERLLAEQVSERGRRETSVSERAAERL